MNWLERLYYRRRFRRLFEALKQLTLPESKPVRWSQDENGNLVWEDATLLTAADIAAVVVNPDLSELPRLMLMRQYERDLWNLVSQSRQLPHG